VTSQKNILKYFCNEKITHNIINEGCHIDFYGPNVDSLLHSSISQLLTWATVHGGLITRSEIVDVFHIKSQADRTVRRLCNTTINGPNSCLSFLFLIKDWSEACQEKNIYIGLKQTSFMRSTIKNKKL
jgi:hypothetical protein